MSNDEPFRPFKSRHEAQRFCKNNFTSKMLSVLQVKGYVDCQRCPLDHRSFDKLGLDIGRSGYPCHVNYLALTGELTKERYATIMFDRYIDSPDVLWCGCTERRMRVYKYLTEKDYSEIISVE